MNRNKRRTNKYLLLALILVAVFALPSCRTRLTNNSEVTNIQYDDGGYLTETYQMRRDELGLSTAERPILPSFGAPPEDENDDFAEGESIDYNPEEYEEDFTEPESTTTETTESTTTSNTGSRTTTRTTPTPSRRVTTTTTSHYYVTFDANGGTVTENKGKTFKIKVKKGAKIGTLPAATYSDETKELDGWYTSKTGGSKVKSTDKVNSSFTVYAHWKDKENTTPTPTPTPEPTPTPTPEPQPEPEPAKEYTITFDTDGGEEIKPEKVGEGKYKLPKAPSKKGYDFGGWNDGSSIHEAGAEVEVKKDMTFTAIWNPTAETSWTEQFDKARKDATEKNSLLLETSSDESTLIQDCKIKSNPDDYSIVVKFASNVSDTLTSLANETDPEGNPKYAGKKIIVVSSSATKNNKNKLAYQISLMNIIHDSGMDAGKAVTDLLGDDGEVVIETMDV